jgi:hypothetical protein
MQQREAKKERSNFVDIDLVVVAELESALAFLLAHRICLVDLRVLGKFAVCFHYVYVTSVRNLVEN